MKKHTKIYIDYFGIVEQDNPLCEWCETNFIVDIHHLKPRGAGGSKSKDVIENLMGLCRECHDRAEFVKEPYLYSDELTQKHLKNL